MTWRTNVKLLVVAVLLTLYFRFFESDPASWERLGKVFTDLQTSEIVEIELSRPADASDARHGADTRDIVLRYEKVGNDVARWWIIEPIRFPAFHPRVQGIVYEIVDMVRVAEVSSPPADLFSGPPVLRVRFKTRSGGETVIEVGRDHPDTSLDFSYVRVQGDVFVTRKEFRKNVRATLTELRSRTIFPVSHQDTARLTIHASDGAALSVAKEESTGRWRLEEPFPALADREITETLLKDFNSWAIADFVSDEAVGAGELQRYGLETPRFVVTVISKDGRVVTLEVGKEIEDATEAGEAEPRVYMRHSGEPHVFAASAEPLKDLARPAEEFRSRYVFDLRVAEVEALDGEVLRGPGRGQKFAARRLEVSTEERRDGQVSEPGSYVWQIEDRARDESFRGNRELIETIVRDLRKLRVEKFLTAGELAPGGLDPPRARLTLRLDSGRSVELRLGDHSSDPIDRGANVYYASRPDEEGGYLLLTRLPVILEEGAYALRARDISNVEADSVVAVEIRRAGTTWSLSRPSKETSWSLPADVPLADGMRVKGELLDDLCEYLGRDVFRVARFLPDEADLESLDWTVSLWTSAGAEPQQQLFVGRPVAGSRPLEYAARFEREGVPVFTIEQDIPDLLGRVHAHLRAITVGE